MKKKEKRIFCSTSQPSQPTKCIFSEPRCGPIDRGASISLSMPHEFDMPQPIIDRRPSVTLFKWGGSQKRSDAPTPTAARQGLHFIYHPTSHLQIHNVNT